MDAAYSTDSSFNAGSFQWKLGDLLKSGEIVRTGYDEYRIAGESAKPAYSPQYSELANEISEKLSSIYPYVQFTVFETVLLNEFLNHLIAQDTVFIQVEKDSSPFLFRALQEAGYTNVMYKPSAKERELYWTKDSVIVADMISEAPISNEHPHQILLEKMLVDIFCDKYIVGTYTASEFPEILRQADASYRLDRTKMLRYARRRNREKDLRTLLDRID